MPEELLLLTVWFEYLSLNQHICTLDHDFVGFLRHFCAWKEWTFSWKSCWHIPSTLDFQQQYCSRVLCIWWAEIPSFWCIANQFRFEIGRCPCTLRGWAHSCRKESWLLTFLVSHECQWICLWLVWSRPNIWHCSLIWAWKSNQSSRSSSNLRWTCRRFWSSFGTCFCAEFAGSWAGNELLWD